MQSDGLALSIEIGTHEFRCRLPLLPIRFKVWEAYDDCTEKAKVLVALTDDERAQLQGELEKRLDLRLRAELEKGVDDIRKEEIEAILKAGVQLHNVDHSISTLNGFELKGDVVFRVEIDFELIDQDDLVSLSVAAIGLCWDDEPLSIEVDVVRKGKPARETFLVPGQTNKLFRALGRDMVALGEHVIDALSPLGDFTSIEVYRSGRALREKIVASIPRVVEVNDAADFTEAGTEPSTESSSSQD